MKYRDNNEYLQPWTIQDHHITNMSMAVWRFIATLDKISGETRSLQCTKYDLNQISLQSQLRKSPWFKKTSL